MRKPLIVVALAASLVASGCGADKSREDAGDVTKVCPENVNTEGATYLESCVDKSPKRVIANHNLFPNLATGCDGYGHRYYVSTRRNQDPIVIDDPSCPGGAR